VADDQPDGQQMVAEWYMQNVGTPYELSALPRLYQDYVGHDNNRDAYMLNMMESRVSSTRGAQWEPQIIYVHHQSAPFPTRIWLPPFSEPVGIDAPFLMSREVNMIGMAIAKGLEERARSARRTWARPSTRGIRATSTTRRTSRTSPAFWTETALFQYATPREYTIDDFPQNIARPAAAEPVSSPWPPGRWRLRDAVEYMETASLSVLEFAAKYKDSLLYNRYQAGRDQIALGGRSRRIAYVVPRQQRDPVAASSCSAGVAFGGVRVAELTEPATPVRQHSRLARGRPDRPGVRRRWRARCSTSSAIRTAAVSRRSPERPYDAAGWSLPLQMACASSPRPRPLPDDVRAYDEDHRRRCPSRRIKPTPYEAALEDRCRQPFDSLPWAGFDSRSVVGCHRCRRRARRPDRARC
jgi:hypothetical protein